MNHAPAAAASVEDELQELVVSCYADPLRWVMLAYPWGEPGPLEHEPGPDANQQEFLAALGAEVRRRRFDGHTPTLPILMAETSGHGTGKSAMGAWLAGWILSTRPHSIGTVTAGTETQLKERTWAAIQHWMSLCITAHWFDVQAFGIYSISSPKDWKLVRQSCRKENAQSFAGQHARTSTSWYLFDEASEVDDEIWRTAFGGLTDGEPMLFAWGQMTRNTGMFYRVCFGDQRERWNHRRVDSRTSRFTNQALITQWATDYGEESDFYKVRVLGLPPSASELQYIDKARVQAARQRVQVALPDDSLIAGFDVSGGGAAWNVIRFRRGLNGDVLPPWRLPGEADTDRSVRIAKCAELLADRRPEYYVSMLFVDAAFGAPIVERLRALGFGTRVQEVSFGADSPDPHQKNQRAYMWAKAKDWLLHGALPAGDEHLAEQLCLPGYHLDQRSRLVLESKADIAARGEASPDDADAFALTFARPVQLSPQAKARYRSHATVPSVSGEGAWAV